jgi:hypothetical protein
VYSAASMLAILENPREISETLSVQLLRQIAVDFSNLRDEARAEISVEHRLLVKDSHSLNSSSILPSLKIFAAFRMVWSWAFCWCGAYQASTRRESDIASEKELKWVIKMSAKEKGIPE